MNEIPDGGAYAALSESLARLSGQAPCLFVETTSGRRPVLPDIVAFVNDGG